MHTSLWLFFIFFVALLARSSPGSHEYQGVDSFYELRDLEHVLASGKSLGMDKALNFPAGLENPNPPLWIWLTAPFAHGNPAAALGWSTAIFGAAIVLPVFMMGRDLFGRSAGLWASSLTALSSAHIQRTSFAFAKHDAATIFFITLGIAFLVRGLILSGRPGALLWSDFSGIAFASAALMWKGYVYVLGIVAVAAVMHCLVCHWRKTKIDVSPFVMPLFWATVLPFVLYYRTRPEFLPSTILPSAGLLVLVLVSGLALTMAAKIRPLVIVSVTVGASIVGLVILKILSPGLFEMVPGLAYFFHNPLYATISEAQSPSPAEVVAGFGFGALLVAVWAFPRATRGALAGRPEKALFLSFAVISFLLCLSARRFLPSAAPVVAILAGVGASRLFRSLGRPWNRQKGLSLAALALLLPLPAMAGGIASAAPAEPEIQAFGWIPAMQTLAERDTGVPLEERPGVLAWWDYGHWIVQEGKHPAVADPFQDHFQLVASFLTAQNESEAERTIAGMGVGYLVVDYRMLNSTGGIFFAPANLAGKDPSASYGDSMFARAFLRPESLHDWTLVWRSDKVVLLQHKPEFLTSSSEAISLV